MLRNDSHTLLGGVILWYNEITPGMLYHVEKLLLHTRWYGVIKSECMLSLSYFLEKGESFENVKYIQIFHHVQYDICILVTKGEL